MVRIYCWWMVFKVDSNHFSLLARGWCPVEMHILRQNGKEITLDCYTQIFHTNTTWFSRVCVACDGTVAPSPQRNRGGGKGHLCNGVVSRVPSPRFLSGEGADQGCRQVVWDRTCDYVYLLHSLQLHLNTKFTKSYHWKIKLFILSSFAGKSL